MAMSVRSLYAQSEPHRLRPGEQVLGWLVRGADMTLWYIGKELTKRGRGRRRHDGRLRKGYAHQAR